jgi:hypothetical protein
MIHKKRFAIMFLLCIASFVITGGSCDRTQLSGEVVVADTRIKVGEVVPLQLAVPESLSEIYRVEWEVEPQERGDVLFGAQLLEILSEEEYEYYFGSSEEINADRVALFLPKEKGTSTIHVTGFYKQTNPQPITAISLEVME